MSYLPSHTIIIIIIVYNFSDEILQVRVWE